ncbi:MAG: c-type cytochrome, partial [Deltaproteobacteria bacterium]|nr:c-type cytochrome [Deltaproteobacteria bacterium]
MKRFSILTVILLLGTGFILWNQAMGVEKGSGYLLPGEIKEGWKVFTTKRCGVCHSIWGEGGKGGPDLGTLPKS